MKKTLTILFLLLISSVASIANDENLIAFKKGTILVYEMEKNSQKSSLTITIESTKPDLVFSFKLEGAEKKSGKIKISEKAINASTKLLYEFNLPEQTLTDATCFFFSFEYFSKIENIETQIYWEHNEAADSSTCPITINNSAAPIIIGGISREVESLMVNGKLIQFHTDAMNEVRELTENDVDYKTLYNFRIGRNMEFPIISFANFISYSLVLTEIKNAQLLRKNYATNEYEKVDSFEE